MWTFNMNTFIGIGLRPLDIDNDTNNPSKDNLVKKILKFIQIQLFLGMYLFSLCECNNLLSLTYKRDSSSIEVEEIFILFTVALCSHCLNFELSYTKPFHNFKLISIFWMEYPDLNKQIAIRFPMPFWNSFFMKISFHLWQWAACMTRLFWVLCMESFLWGKGERRSRQCSIKL